MDLDTSHIADPEIRKFIEIAYLRQTEEDIWGLVIKAMRVGNLREEMMKFRANKAPGPSGVSIKMIKLMSDANPEVLVKTMNGIMTKGEQAPESWNMALLRPLPKMEACLYDIRKTSPIALMEVIVKLLESVVFSRIDAVIDNNSMPRSE